MLIGHMAKEKSEVSRVWGWEHREHFYGNQDVVAGRRWALWAGQVAISVDKSCLPVTKRGLRVSTATEAVLIIKEPHVYVGLLK
jgi:hypothetical protein